MAGELARHNARSQGFTLLEIMVAMIILTLIVTASFGALRLGERSWEIGLERSAKTETLRSVSSVLSRLLSQAIPIEWQLQGKKQRAFEGSSQQFRFIGPAPAHNGATGLFEYTLALLPGARDSSLMLYYRLHDPDRNAFAEDDSERQQVVLVEDLERGAFSFYGEPEARGAKPDWHDFWSAESAAYPQMVRINLEANAEQDRWPDLYLRVQAEAE